MSKAVFAICDSESMYIYNLMEYVHSRKGEEFEVQAFTGVESLCACAKEKTIEILLISGKLLCEQVRELQIRKVMVLSEGEQICELSEYSAAGGQSDRGGHGFLCESKGSTGSCTFQAGSGSNRYLFAGQTHR